MTEQELKELSETYPNGEYNYTTERQAALDYLERVAFPKHEKGVKIILNIDYIGNIYEYIGTSAGRLIFQETGSVWHHVTFSPALFEKWCEEGVITVIEEGEVL